ncbi:hypothetical protein NHX12_026897, partial [Muraenolepis orangiensis]
DAAPVRGVLNVLKCRQSVPGALAQPPCAHLRVTSSPMVVQSLGPWSSSRTRGPVALATPQPPAHPQGVAVPCGDARSLLSRESLASTTLSLWDTQSVLSGRQDWPHGYRVLPPLAPLLGSPLTGLSLSPPGEGGTTAMSGASNCASLPSYLFSCRSRSPRLKRALSTSPLSDAMGVDFNAVIRTSPTSLVAYINGAPWGPSPSHRPSLLSPPAVPPPPHHDYGHFLGARGSCLHALAPVPGGPGECQGFPGEAVGPEETPAGDSNPGDGLPLPPAEPPSLSTHLLQQAAAPRGPPPPADEPLSLPPHGNNAFSFLSLVLPGLGSHGCHWADCGAVYDRREELVRHIETLHLDQRRGEEFACRWAGCPRRFRPFNARYKLLIHMRKPYACQVPGCVKRYTDPSSLRKHVKSHSSRDRQLRKKLRSSAGVSMEELTGCLTIQPLQANRSPLGLASNLLPSYPELPGHTGMCYPPMVCAGASGTHPSPGELLMARRPYEDDLSSILDTEAGPHRPQASLSGEDHMPVVCVDV